jgi:hypothetical protein
MNDKELMLTNETELVLGTGMPESRVQITFTASFGSVFMFCLKLRTVRQRLTDFEGTNI